MSSANELFRYALASSGAYGTREGEIDLAKAGLELLEAHSEPSTDSQAIACRDGATLVIAFRGTESIRDMLTDASIGFADFRAARLGGASYDVHRGFYEAWVSLRVWANQMTREHQDWPREIIVCGHSLGGALATLAAVDLWAERPIRAFTYGSPRVAFHGFASAYARAVTETTRVVHDEDIVPTIPGWPYWHVDQLLRLNDQGREAGATKGVLRGLLGFGRDVASRLDGEALADHHVARYIDACHQHTLVTAAA